MSNELPDEPQPQNQDADSEARVLTIENLHLYASDIDALRRLSELDPELARVVVDQKDAFDRRDHASYRFGLMAAVLLVLGNV